jgi:hypothetical protein
VTWVFDLDGTLVLTQAAVIAAYEHVGICMPPQAWGRPWVEWLRTEAGLPDHAAHAAKNRVYPSYLARLARPTGLLRHAVINRCPILTGASNDAVRAVEACFEVDLNVAGFGLSLQDKIEWLNDNTPGVYVDDDEKHRRAVSERTLWKVVCPTHASQLLSLPPGPTRD